jgi:hypothetical protein
VLDQAATAALARAVTDEQRCCFTIAFDCARARLRDHGLSPDGLDSARIPALVYAAVAGDPGPAAPLGVALTVLYVGMDLWDSVMDRELPPAWDGVPPHVVSLAAAALIGGVAPVLVSDLDAPAGRVVAVQRTLGRAFIAIAAGQQSDIAAAGAIAPTSELAEEAMRGKSGEVLALFAETAALLAGAPSDSVAAYADMGRAMGMASQIRADLSDLYSPAGSRDLANGTRSLPIALYLEQLEGDVRDRFVALLDHARVDADAQTEVRAALLDADIHSACALLAEAYCARAQQELQRSNALEPACSGLRSLIESTSLIRPALNLRT